jgi:hypothetical protein
VLRVGAAAQAVFGAAVATGSLFEGGQVAGSLQSFAQGSFGLLILVFAVFVFLRRRWAWFISAWLLAFEGTSISRELLLHARSSPAFAGAAIGSGLCGISVLLLWIGRSGLLQGSSSSRGPTPLFRAVAKIRGLQAVIILGALLIGLLRFFFSWNGHPPGLSPLAWVRAMSTGALWLAIFVASAVGLWRGRRWAYWLTWVVAVCLLGFGWLAFAFLNTGPATLIIEETVLVELVVAWLLVATRSAVPANPGSSPGPVASMDGQAGERGSISNQPLT